MRASPIVHSEMIMAMTGIFTVLICGTVSGKHGHALQEIEKASILDPAAGASFLKRYILSRALLENLQ